MNDDKRLNNKVYLGDSVYVNYDGYMLTLTTENDSGPPSNIIYLEPGVYTGLVQYTTRMKELKEEP